jgi:excisionase family DNA binding protein
MAELLTTKQLQELLKVDRVTVYRMLNDGRLKGIKVGNQWRFHQKDISLLLGDEKPGPEQTQREVSVADFPVDCAQKVQAIFAGILGIGAAVVSLQGDPVTEVTHCNPYCQLILDNPSGRAACLDSWRRIALRTSGQPPFQVCHAGLKYLRSPILSRGTQVAWLFAGQFYIASPDDDELKKRLESQSLKFIIPLSKLVEAANKIPFLRASQLSQVQKWTPEVAHAVQSFICEREDLMDRLQRISEISTVRPVLITQTQMD